MSSYSSEPTPESTPAAMPDPAGLEPEPVADLGPDPIADLAGDPIPTPTAGDIDPGEAAAAGAAAAGTTDHPAAGSSDRDPALRPLYALAGLTDLLAASVRKTIADTAEEANRRRAEAQARLGERTQVASGDASPEELRRLLAALPIQLKALPDLARSRAQELQAQATARYNELTGRGKLVVDGAVTSARGLTAKAEQRAGSVRTEVVERIDPTLDLVQQKVAAARRAAAGDAKSPVYQPSTPAPSTEPLSTEPTTIPDAGTGPVDSRVDEVIITPVAHGDEVPPSFDAPASDVPPSTGGPSSGNAG